MTKLEHIRNEIGSKHYTYLKTYTEVPSLEKYLIKERGITLQGNSERLVDSDGSALKYYFEYEFYSPFTEEELGSIANNILSALKKGIVFFNY